MKNFLLLLVIFITQSVYAEAATQPAEQAYQSCVQSWAAGLAKNFPTITEVDAKYVSQYYCLCAIDYAETNQGADPDKQTKIYRKCLPYAVLRNALHYQVETPTGKVNAGVGSLYGACQLAFPHDVKNKDDIALVANFCECASKPLAVVEEEKKDLTEDQIREKVTGIVGTCNK